MISKVILLLYLCIEINKINNVFKYQFKKKSKIIYKDLGMATSVATPEKSDKIKNPTPGPCISQIVLKH